MTESVGDTNSFDKKQDDILNFIESVSSSNLETFHSKSIAWLLNSLNPRHSWFKGFYNEFSENKNDSIIHMGTVAEFKNHDLVTLLKANGCYEIVFWENKIKADFHQVKLSKRFFKNIDRKKVDFCKLINYLSQWNRGISQPYYYLLRYYSKDINKQKEWKKDIIEKIRESGTKVFNTTNIDFNEIKLNWLILSPYHQDELEKFHKQSWIGIEPLVNKFDDKICGDRKLFQSTMSVQNKTDWKFTTFKRLFSTLISDHLNDIQKCYINYLKKENWFRGFTKLGQGKENSRGRNREWTILMLLDVYKAITKESNLPIEFKWKIKGSAKTPQPLLNICFVRNNRTQLTSEDFVGILKYNTKKDNNCVDTITCNIQLQGQSVKLQMSHWDYDNVILSSKKAAKDEYSRKVTERFTNKKIYNGNLQNAVNQWLKSTDFGVKGEPNLPRSKTGLSFTLRERKEGIGKDNRQLPTSRKILKLCIDVHELLNCDV